MRKWIAILFVGLGLMTSSPVFAYLSMELTRGVAGAVPIAIVPFAINGVIPSENVSQVVTNDLKNSGRFKVYSNGSVRENMPPRYYRSIGADTIVTGRIEQIDGGRYEVSFKLFNALEEGGAPLLSQQFTVPESQLRGLAHHISDLIYRQMIGVRGVFSTKLAYIVVQRSHDGSAQYILEVSDADGYNPKPLLISNDPIMSPAWSPNGRQIAYVSFENKHSAIYVEDVATGSRRLISDFKGINGAPAWSPDGRKLALVLSKDGSPNIYFMDVGSRQLTKVTNDWSINTEPAWSRDGRSIIFTSNRSGGPQIYQKNLATGTVSRVTYEGNYNARASYTPDGNHIVVLNQESKLFNIGILDLDTSSFRVLTNASGTDNESPSVAPNGSMILYGTLYGGRSVLSMVASDGSVQLRLPARNGEVQDPAWSPYLS
ncbi:MAG TPA: Tol-Pal system beta propeller repeat protein TolB [Gammaproteobacteria bacterium]|nr:Tol-Pal system beta propeller repeat protein TolB [Gammaproteobacteria bacterium]